MRRPLWILDDSLQPQARNPSQFDSDSQRQIIYLIDLEVRLSHRSLAGLPADRVLWVAQQRFRSRVGLPELVLCRLRLKNLVQVGRRPVQNGPGLRPGQFLTGRSSMFIRFGAQAGPKPALKARPADRKHY
jgi:hypothetical protein